MLFQLVLLLVQGCRLTYTARFTQWFQQFEDKIGSAVHVICSQQYNRHVAERDTIAHLKPIASRLIACLFAADTLDEATKANIASA